MKEMKARIEAGAKLLDEKIPEWLCNQNTSRLNMASECQCILGMADEGDFWVTLRKLFPLAQSEKELFLLAYEYGFNIKPPDEGLTPEDNAYYDGLDVQYDDLTDGWKAYIQERRRINGR